MKKIMFYTNQFFGHVGGESEASFEPVVQSGAVGPAIGIMEGLGDMAEAVCTVICGDNYYSEHQEEARSFVKAQLKACAPDLVIAGPAFNAGRFGVACGDVCTLAKSVGIEAFTAANEENPCVEVYKKNCYILKIARSAAGMRQAIALMSGFARKLLLETSIGSPEEESYFAQGRRVNVFREKNGAERAVDMLVAKVRGEEFKTELEISSYEKVVPAEPIRDLGKAKIALCTSGGIVPAGNPDHQVAATAKFWVNYPLGDVSVLEKGAWESVHAGYDPVYANEDPNRVAPVDILRTLEKEGVIGELYPFMPSTTGNSTSVADATRMGKDIAKTLVEAGVNGVLLTST